MATLQDGARNQRGGGQVHHETLQRHLRTCARQTQAATGASRELRAKRAEGEVCGTEAAGLAAQPGSEGHERKPSPQSGSASAGGATPLCLCRRAHCLTPRGPRFEDTRGPTCKHKAPFTPTRHPHATTTYHHHDSQPTPKPTAQANTTPGIAS